MEIVENKDNLKWNSMGLSRFFNVAIIVGFVYIFLFNPPVKVLPNLILLSLPFIYGYLMYHSLVAKLIYLFKNEILILLLLALCTLIRDFDWTTGLFNITFIYGNILVLIAAIPFGLVIADLCYRKCKPYHVPDDNKLVNIILWTCIIAAIITFLLFIFPSFNFKMNNSILKASDYQRNNLLRGFGFATQLLFGYGLVQGTAAAVMLLKMSESKKYFLVFFVAFTLLLISVLVNARIGMTPIVIMMLYLIFVKGRIKMFIYGSVIFGLLIGAFLSTSYAEKYSKTIEWAMGFFIQTTGFVSGSKSGQSPSTYDVLLNNMVIFPDTFMDWMVGTGNDLFAGDKDSQIIGTVGHSDIGFIRQLYFGGLIYLGLIFLLITTMAIRIYQLKKCKWFLSLFVFTVILGNIKGYFVASQPGFLILILIYIGFIYFSFLSNTNQDSKPVVD